MSHEFEMSLMGELTFMCCIEGEIEAELGGDGRSLTMLEGCLNRE